MILSYAMDFDSNLVDDRNNNECTTNATVQLEFEKVANANVFLIFLECATMVCANELRHDCRW